MCVCDCGCSLLLCTATGTPIFRWLAPLLCFRCDSPLLQMRSALVGHSTKDLALGLRFSVQLVDAVGETIPNLSVAKTHTPTETDSPRTHAHTLYHTRHSAEREKKRKSKSYCCYFIFIFFAAEHKIERNRDILLIYVSGGTPVLTPLTREKRKASRRGSYKSHGNTYKTAAAGNSGGVPPKKTSINKGEKRRGESPTVNER